MATTTVSRPARGSSRRWHRVVLGRQPIGLLFGPFVAGAIAGIGYGLIALVARIAVPWARTTTGVSS